MKKSYLTLLVLTFLLAVAGSLPAQDSEQTCVVVLTAQNRDRTVAGASMKNAKIESSPFNFMMRPGGTGEWTRITAAERTRTSFADGNMRTVH